MNNAYRVSEVSLGRNFRNLSYFQVSCIRLSQNNGTCGTCGTRTPRWNKC